METTSRAALATPTDPGDGATRDVAAALNGLLADLLNAFVRAQGPSEMLSCVPAAPRCQ